jgi:hypothetical protein
LTVSNFMLGWVALLGSLATIAIILTAFELMLGIVQPADAPWRIAAILGIVIVLTLIPGMLVSAWLGMSLWEQTAFVAIAIAVWQSLKSRRQARKRKDE